MYSKSPECAKLLLGAGVDVNCKNAKDNTPLMVAAALGHYNVLKLLVTQTNIDVNAQVCYACTLYMYSLVPPQSSPRKSTNILSFFCDFL